MTTERTWRQYQAEAAAIATTIWEISTGNGRDLDRDAWDEHMQNCHAAVASTYVDGIDGIDGSEWQAAALARVAT